MSSQGITVRKYGSTRVGSWIERYTFVERVNHWIGSAAYLYLLVTGLAFWSPYLYWMAAMVGGGPTARFWHPWLRPIACWCAHRRRRPSPPAASSPSCCSISEGYWTSFLNMNHLSPARAKVGLPEIHNSVIFTPG